MSSLSFVPRKVTKGSNAQKPKPQSVIAETSKSSVASANSSSTLVTASTPSGASEESSKYDEQDYANLIALSLSDYALWVDADIRQKLGSGVQPGFKEDARYVSLNYLFEHSACLACLLDSSPKKESKAIRSKIQSALVKGLRSQASHLFDVRLLLHPDETIPCFGKQKEVGGGYEVRRKRVGLVMRGKSDWDACTLYVEDIPPGYRSYAEIICFMNHLLDDAPPISSSSALPFDPLTRIQGISFPSHYNDKSDTRPSCKGFALVTFAHISDCEHLKDRWPWLRASRSGSETAQCKPDGEKDAAATVTEATRVAHQYGFRVIAKGRWLLLKTEYLTYRQKLVEEMNVYQDTRQAPPGAARGSNPSNPHNSSGPTILPSTHVLTPDDSANTIPVGSLSLSSPYPPNCLVFVKHVHPQTTKTSLRNLFSQAFRSPHTPPSPENPAGLDYVDFNKGMDTCYLRLTTPAYTATLMNYFDHGTHKIVQVSGMDETGTDVSSGTSSIPPQGLKPIVVDRVIGRPEEFYWEKVPAKVKRAAVEKAVQLVKIADNERSGDVASDGRKRSLESTSKQKDETLSKRKKRKL
ncbi:hypothetical protein AN958_03614 [Leucoagaricus sp. SymC.cos]|nr:hypothetical protein AN958_03614 [Leucoagaricus sp. SymC.cos]